MNDDQEIEEEYSYDKQKLANFVARIASEIRKGTLLIKGKEIQLPQHFDVKYEYEKEDNENEIEIKFKWKE